MAATSYPHDGSALPFRVATLERNETKTADEIIHLREDNATFKEQMIGVREDLGGLHSSVDKVYWAIIGGSITVATSAIGAALVVALSK